MKLTIDNYEQLPQNEVIQFIPENDGDVCKLGIMFARNIGSVIHYKENDPDTVESLSMSFETLIKKMTV